MMPLKEQTTEKNNKVEKEQDYTGSLQSLEDYVYENPENAGNTQLLSSVLDQLLSNPYEVELQRPEFEYHQKTFYALK